MTKSWHDIFKQFIDKLLDNFVSVKVWVLFMSAYFFMKGKLDHIDWLLIASSFLGTRILEYLIKLRGNGKIKPPAQ